MGTLSKTFKALTVGTALTTMMVGGTVGLATPQEAEASTEGKIWTGILGALGAGAVVYGLKHQGNAGVMGYDPSCGRNMTTTSNYGSYYNQSTTQSIYCPPQAMTNYNGGYASAPQQIIVQPPAKTQAEIQMDMMKAEQLAAERQKLQLENEADFYASIPKMRLERATGFCMNVNDPQYLDADNRSDCGAILNRTKQGRDFLAAVRPDMLKGAGQQVAAGGADQQCSSEVVKESYDANGKLTGRTIEKTMKPCR